MGRPFAACLGCIAMLSQILSGMVHGQDTEAILVRCLIATVIAAIPGWIIGQLADAVVRESIEASYRRQIEQIRQQPKAESTAS
jgi:tetrahydromethanopterin S-methyltransferase subunit C